jgi:hypothetical protein
MECFPVYVLQRNVGCLRLKAAYIKHLYDAGVLYP